MLAGCCCFFAALTFIVMRSCGSSGAVNNSVMRPFVVHQLEAAMQPEGRLESWTTAIQ